MTVPTQETIKVFSARACAAPLEKAAALFESQSGIHVEISVCGRHCASAEAEDAVGSVGGDDFMAEIADEGVHDLAVGGAEYLLDDGEVRGIVARGQRRSIARRASALLLPVGNPKNIQSLEDLCKPGVQVAISVLDCLKGVWEDVCGRSRLLEPVRKNITFYANGCIAIVEAIAQGKADVAFGWSAFGHLERGRIDILSLPPEQTISRGTGIALLKFSSNPQAAIKFMDFLTTPQARAFYVEYGWEL